MFGWEASTFGAALLLGLFGGVHCVGMCGGIVTALSHRDSVRNPDASVWIAPLVYNGARIASYSAVGAIAGAMGAGLGNFVGPEGSLALRVALGILFVFLGLHVAGVLSVFGGIEKVGLAVWRRVAPAAIGAGRRGGILSLLILGALWGWLPCGLVYAAAAGAAATGSAGHGAVLMLGFGLGTLPLLVASGAAAQGLRRWTLAPHARAAAGVLLVVAGAWTVFGALPSSDHGDHSSTAHRAHGHDSAPHEGSLR